MAELGGFRKGTGEDSHKHFWEALVSRGGTTTKPVILGKGATFTPMAHRVEWWPFGTVIRRARLDTYYKAMYIGDAKAIVLDDHYSEVIEVNPDDWVSVPETGF